MLFEDNTKVDFEVFQSDTDYTCDDIDISQKVQFISHEMKSVIIDVHELRMTPKYIAKHIDNLRKNDGKFLNEETPSPQQMHYIIRVHKNSRNPKMLYLGQLIDWCEKNENVPDDEDHQEWKND